MSKLLYDKESFTRKMCICPRIDTFLNLFLCSRCRAEDNKFRSLDKKIRMVNHKRHHVDTRVGQLSILAELAALMNAFQMIVLYEIGMPDLNVYRFQDYFLAIWGFSCCSVACINCGIMMLATFMNFSILDASANEGREGDIDGADTEMYDLDHPDGAMVCPEQFTVLWIAEHEAMFRSIVEIFTLTVPVFMANLGAMGFVRFYFYQQVEAGRLLLVDFCFW
jgi:hypothetical protein